MSLLTRVQRVLNLRLGSVAVVDQAVVGGANFLTAVIVGRIAGAEQLGYYALALTAWYFILAVLESLITSPFTVFVHRRAPTERARFAGSVLVHVALLAVLGMAAGCVATATLWLTGATSLAVVYGAMTATLPFRLLRQFVRRFDYAYLQVRRALLLDLGIAAGQLGGLLVLVQTVRLTAAAALIVVGVAHAVAGIYWLAKQRALFQAMRSQLAIDFAKNWGLGKWLAGSQLAGIAAAQALPWLIAFRLDETATGVYAACAMLVGLAAPLLVAVQNILTPRSAAAYAAEGIAGLRRVVRKTTILLGLGIGSLAATFWIAGEWVVIFFFGNDFIGNGRVVAFLGTAEFLYALALGAMSACTVLERSDLLFRCHASGTLLTLAAAWPLISRFGLPGAAAAQLAGIGLGAACITACYWRLSAGRHGPQPDSAAPSTQSERATDHATEPALQNAKSL